MIDDCIRFHQSTFLHRMAREPHLRNAHSWFRTRVRLDPQNVFSWFYALDLVEKRHEVVRSDLAIFMNAAVDLVVSNTPNLPATFEYDIHRLYRLQAEFQECIRMVTYCVIFIKALAHLGFVVSPSRETCDKLSRDIADLTATLDAAVDSDLHFETVTLELVRQAHQYCGDDSLPSDALLEEMETTLRKARNPFSEEFQQVQAILYNDLYNGVEDYVICSLSLSPMTIIDRLNPIPSDPYAPEEDVDLPVVARRLAHILVLHWKVWAPILYQQPWDRVANLAVGQHGSSGTGEDGPGDGTGGSDNEPRGGRIGAGSGGGREPLSWGGSESGSGNGSRGDSRSDSKGDSRSDSRGGGEQRSMHFLELAIRMLNAWCDL